MSSNIFTTIEAFGSTSLVENGSNYFLEPAGETAVELSYGGAPAVAGQFGGWTPIGAEQTANGYEVAWKVTGSDQYTVWSTDSSGNYLSSAFVSASGSSAELQSFEPSFQQDLNGDGTIGVPSTPPPPPPPPPSVIESFGTTSLAEVGSNYLLEPAGETAVELSYGGAPAVAGQFGGWTPIGAEQTANGYEVAWKVTGSDQYTVWSTDANGNYLSSAFVSASGSSAELQSFEPSFQQDLNGDGTIGVPSTPPPPPPPPPSVIESFGTTSLAEVGSNYLLEPAGGPAVELSYGGAPAVAGQFGGWTPIGAEQTESGYEVAWKVTGSDQYTVWSTDSSGNYLSSAFVSASGSSAQLQSFEPSFQQDLNGDGAIGGPSTPPPPPPPPPAVIKSFGSTSLVENGNNYLLEPASGPAVELSYGGAPAGAGQFGGWTPIGAEQTESGYEVAWKVAGSDQYTVWSTDSSGNYLSSAFVSASGSSAQLQSFEPSFQQDLNGDGAIGGPSTPPPPPPPPPSVIESFGTTSLAEVGSNYLLEPASGPAVELSYGGAPAVAGQFGGWTPIGAEQTANGYEVAWKVTGSDQYTVWSTDANGNYLSSAFVSASGSSAELQSFEPSFQQDLNGDGTIGVPSDDPHFVYEGTDANGVQLYDVTWNTLGSHPFAVRVLAPDHPSTAYPHSFLYALPVEGGLAQSTFGSGLDELQKLDVENQYNATIIEPIFPIDPWYADNPIDPTVDYETFTSTLLPEWVDSNFATSGAEKNLLIGFSKSGYGALDLEFKHPSVFDAAAAWDFPADMTGYGAYGTETNFQDNYELTGAFIDNWKAPFTSQDRIWISGYEVFQNDVSDFDSLLTSHGVMHTLAPQTYDSHAWSGGWLPKAVAGLYGLEQNLNNPTTT